MKSIQVTIQQLESIIENAKKAKELDNSLSSTIIIDSTKPTDSHLGGDIINAYLKSGYSECNSKNIY
jgi:hypothetical protein